MENTEVIKALRCGGHNMMFTYCNKVDCPFCQFSYYDKLHKCNIQELGAKAADALEAAEKRIAELERQHGEQLTRNVMLVARLPKEGAWISTYDGFEYDVRCSVCGEEALIKEGGSHDHAYSHYCPNCGCAMGGEKK